MKIIVTRHGQTDWNKKGKFQGISDIGLNRKGKQEVKDLAERLKDEDIFKIFTSPLKRALSTAEEIKKYHEEAELVVEDNLRELSYGVFEGLTPQDVRREFGEDVWRRRVKDKYNFEIPEGESYNMAEARINKLIEKILEENKDIIVVCHGGVGKLLIKNLARIPFKKVDKDYLKSAGLTILEKEKGKWKIKNFNDKKFSS